MRLQSFSPQGSEDNIPVVYSTKSGIQAKAEFEEPSDLGELKKQWYEDCSA